MNEYLLEQELMETAEEMFYITGKKKLLKKRNNRLESEEIIDEGDTE